jgi:Co/Zn/Cd efflux system component
MGRPETLSRTEFKIAKMDCSAEEQLVRCKLEPIPGIRRLRFDLPARKLEVLHTNPAGEVRALLEELRLGAVEVVHEDRDSPEADEDLAAEDAPPAESTRAREKGPLVAAFSINLGLFAAELIAGILAYSLGLVGDSLDMLADAVVYATALAAVGGTLARKASIARLTGYFQAFLACAGLAEVVRRALGGDGVPDFRVMIAVSLLALAGNAATLLLLNRTRGAGVHMQAAWICTSVDVQVNALVMLSAGAVYLTRSRFPDLIVGAIIFLLVANGSRRILALAR